MGAKQNIDSDHPDILNLNQYYEIQYWTKTLGINSEKLTEAIAEMDNATDAFKKYYHKKISSNI